MGLLGAPDGFPPTPARVRLPLAPPLTNLPASGCNREAGNVLGYEPRTGFGNPLSFWLCWPEESKAKMTCHNCQITCNRFGKHRNGLQRYRCSQCRKTFTENHTRPLDEMRLPVAKAEAILKLLVEGVSVRSIERITQVHRDTILRLLLLAGERCQKLMDSKMQNLKLRYLQIDEVWTYVQKKARRVKDDEPEEWGDAWIFVCLDEETKLVPAFLIGKRTASNTQTFLWDLYHRLAQKTQVTTDGFHHYWKAVPECFGTDASFAQLVKLYGEYGQHGTDARYSPGPILEVISKVRSGNPDPEHISTSFVERQNLTMRMQIRRMTRLTNAFSKKLENLKAAVALHFAWYNFVRVHKTLRVSPAMEAGLTDHVWTMQELVS
jgi:transposase-like protein/IS1 family transposase